MQTAESLKRRISTTEDLHSLVGTMKAMAAVSIHQFEQAVRSLADFDRTVQRGFQVVLGAHPELGSSLQASDAAGVGAVVFGSDQGMCGPLNDQVAAHAAAQLAKDDAEVGSRHVLAIGGRIVGPLEDIGLAADDVLSIPSSTSMITELVGRLLVTIERWHSAEGVGRIILVYAQHQSVASYRPHTVRLLPLDQSWLDDLRRQPWPSRMLPMPHGDPATLFAALVRSYLFVSLYRASAESMASENASRLASMQRAQRNIEERLAELTRGFHQQRQTAITGELLDIAAGFEAMTGG